MSVPPAGVQYNGIAKPLTYSYVRMGVFKFKKANRHPPKGRYLNTNVAIFLKLVTSVDEKGVAEHNGEPSLRCR